ncbi:MAG: c-type cytochrome [Anaeromyxobacteraceae bacterium]|nr:c-type cytochrome [Anaeromyxobacteraceae bacterium]
MKDRMVPCVLLLFLCAALAGCGGGGGGGGAASAGASTTGDAGVLSGDVEPPTAPTPTATITPFPTPAPSPTTPSSPAYMALFDRSTPLEPPIVEDTPGALITRVSDRARDRHAREDQYQAYDHYLSFYWEHRTAVIEIVDPIGKGGDTITFNVTSLWKLQESQAELRFFYRGINTVAEYHDNASMTPIDDHHYVRTVKRNPVTGGPLRVGDRMEFEMSQFLDSPPRGRENYYGTAFLYIVGRGLVPWEARGVFGDASTEREDSYPIPEAGWLGGRTTLSYPYSGEPDKHFLQMATNLSSLNGQPFVLGRRIHHTDFGDGSHNESTDNPVFTELEGKLGPAYVNRSCVACHAGNGRALPPAVGVTLDRYVVKVGDASGAPHPLLGSVLQPRSTGGSPEGAASISHWSEADGLRTPHYQFTGVTPERHSARIAPQLVGLGLLEAIPESAMEAMADPGDNDGDGISGRIRTVTDPESGQLRVGRFGWKAGQATVRQQAAAALNADIGVMTSVFPSPDRGSSQARAGSAGSELGDEDLARLATYVSLLGVPARRSLSAPVTARGEALFKTSGCTGCHTPTVRTSPYHPHAELRDQVIHPYTDLLLHDMGPGLADNLSEGNAAGSEWRTAPLWGIGLTAGVSGGEAYLHDGRARTLGEAIRWHGGEAEGARKAFEALSSGAQEDLLAFLRSL